RSGSEQPGPPLDNLRLASPWLRAVEEDGIVRHKSREGFEISIGHRLCKRALGGHDLTAYVRRSLSQEWTREARGAQNPGDQQPHMIHGFRTANSLEPDRPGLGAHGPLRGHWRSSRN